MDNNINNFELLDLITIISFAAQLQNMEMDGKQTNFIHKVIKAIADEIDKLHQENDIIIEQLNRIEEKLNGIKR